jgi:hypothetical protein
MCEEPFKKEKINEKNEKKKKKRGMKYLLLR